jgi:hypothetical protein
MVQLYLLAGAIVVIGFVWFWIVRPIFVSIYAAYADWREEREATQARRDLPARRRPALRRRRVMSRPVMRAVARPLPESVVFGAKLTAETAETPQRVAENTSETFTFAETQALARLVAAGKLGLTDAVRIGADAKSGEKYQKRSQEIKAAVAQIQEKYRELTPEQEAVRAQLHMKQKGALN